MTTSSKFAGRQSFLVVFDFDQTIVDCNSDEVVPNYLGRGDYQRSLINSAKMQWTQLMDAVISAFFREQIEEALAKSILMDDYMPDVFRFLINLQQQEKEGKDGDDFVSSAAIEIAIASDANILFIQKSIEHHIPFASDAISMIHSNAFHDVTDCGTERHCRISWYEAKGHDCPSCNKTCPNMCKSRIIARLLHTTRLVDPTVIFVGDGTNDLCPVSNVLRPRDYMFARRGFPIHRLLSEKNSTVGGCCNILLWDNAKELLRIFRYAMSSATRLPTLARFRDVAPDEFRSVTLLRRMPQVLTRTLQNNEATTSTRARKLISAFAEALEKNSEVAPLPGQRVVPPWLQAYSSVLEFDTNTSTLSRHCDCQQKLQRPWKGNGKRQQGDEGAVFASSLPPRWGQLPWLHGEIYFYHLVVQYMLLDDGVRDADGDGNCVLGSLADEWKPNIVTPYVMCSPISTHECQIATHPVVTTAEENSGLDKSFNPSFLARDGSTFAADGILVEGGKKNYSDIAAGDSVVPSQCYFRPYSDCFFNEKRDVLHNFMKTKILKMLACVPWEADETFVPLLLRWMLWGNSVDLSMFTLEQLRSGHNVRHKEGLVEDDRGKGSESVNKRSNVLTDINVDALRREELKAVAAQDDFIVSNHAEDVARLLCRIVREEPTDNTQSRTIDIVMDNIGVECVADLIFALWIIQHHPSLRVTLHVKNMPYYVSDVTPPDFLFLVQELERCAQKEPAMADVFMPFVRLLCEAFEGGRLRIDADAVWTQPCEYRELPPRVCNAFFYTQRVLSEQELRQQQESLDPSLFSSSPHTAYKRYTARSALVIFKGDLNFRRLVGDRHWDSRAFVSTLSAAERETFVLSRPFFRDTRHVRCSHSDESQNKKEDEDISFHKIVSAFWPVHVVPVCAIRTVKSELSVGITAARQTALELENPAWRTTGKYGVILLSSGSL